MYSRGGDIQGTNGTHTGFTNLFLSPYLPKKTIQKKVGKKIVWTPPPQKNVVVKKKKCSEPQGLIERKRKMMFSSPEEMGVHVKNYGQNQ